MTVPTLEQIEQELQEAKQNIADQPAQPTSIATASAIQQLQSGINLLSRHSASNVAGSLFSDALIQFMGALVTLRGIQQ
jgi:hypothetical protein